MTVPLAGPHGGDGARLAAALGISAEEVIDLSASLNPFAPDIAPIVAPHLGSLRRYPDTDSARHVLAHAMSVAPEEVLLTNGGAEAIALACDLVVRRHGGATVREHEFSLYERHLVLKSGAPRVRSNPGNPTGQLVDPNPGHDDDGVPVAVWDEAFWPLATGTWTSSVHRRGAIIVGSLTKVFACPGLRLGYVLADATTISELSLLQPRWAVSTLAADVLPDLLAMADLPGWAIAITQQRVTLEATLRATGWDTISGVNWVLAGLDGISGAELRRQFATQRIAVRDCASFGLELYVRIALPRPDEHTRLTAAIDAVSARAREPSKRLR